MLNIISAFLIIGKIENPLDCKVVSFIKIYSFMNLELKVLPSSVIS